MKAHPTAWWWLKADGCDIVEGLKESLKHEWSGDVDLNDGKLAKLHDEYMIRRKFIESVVINDKRGKPSILSDVQKLKKSLESDITFLSSSKFNSSFKL